MKEKPHVNEKQNKEFLTTFHCQVASGNQVSVSVRVTLEDKCPNHKWPPLLPPFPELFLLSMSSYDTEFPFDQFGSAVLAVCSPDLSLTPGLLAG